MLKLIIYIIFLLAICGFAWLCHRMVRASRYDLGERYLHCRYLAAYFILLAVLYNRYTFSYILLLLDQVINFEPLQGFWNVVLPMRRFELVYLVLSFILSNLWFIIIAGILFLVVRFIFHGSCQYIDVKEMDLPGRLCHLPWAVTSCFFREAENDGVFRVTEKGFTMSLWAKRMKYVFFLLGMGEIIFLTVGIFSSSEFYIEHAVILVQGWYLLPAAGFLLFEQIQYFLEDAVDYEAGSFGIENISEHLEGDMEVLVQLYKNELKSSGALLADYALKDIRVLRDGLIHNSLDQDQIEVCRQPQVLSILNNQLKEAGINQNTAYQNALAAMLNGRSINIRDCAEGEFLVYLAAYMNFFVSQEKTFLILCNSRRTAEKFREALTEKLNTINKIYSIWKIADINNADSNEEMNILVCSYHDLVTHSLVEKRQDFFRVLQGVVLTDGVGFCAQGNVQKEMIFAELGKVRQRLQYVLLSQIDSDSLRTAFEYYTGRELIPYKNDQLPGNMYVMVWAEDSSYKIQRKLGIGSAESPYLGVSLPLSLLAVKYDMPRVLVFAADGKGYYTYHDAMTMSRQEVKMYLRTDVDLDNVIRYNQFPGENCSDLEVMVLYDKEYNFYNLIWEWMKYGGKDQTLIHIVSPSYMLREYFVASLEQNILRNNEFDALIGYRSGMQHTRFLELLLQLCNAGVDEEELMRKNQEYGWGYENVRDLLSACLINVLHTQEFYNIYECFRFEEYCSFQESEDRFVHRTLVRLTDENIRKRIQSKLVFAKQITRGSEERMLPIIKGNLYNYYLRDQVIPLRGHLHRILSMNDGIVFTEQTMTADKEEYFQSGEFVLKNLRKTDECVDFDMLDFNIYTADVSRIIYGYWSSTYEAALQKTGVMKFNSICNSCENPLVVRNRDVQIMEVRMKKSYFTDGGERAVLLAGFMFRELFRTLFPENYMNLYAVTEYEPKERYWERLIGDSSEIPLEEKVHSIVPFVRRDDKQGEDEFSSLYIIEFSSLEMGMISSLYAGRMLLFQMAAAYLEWYLTEESGASWLKLGGADTPECFAPKELLDFCRRVLPSYEEKKEVEEKKSQPEMNINSTHVCSFCGKPALFIYKMSDGRSMCRSCKQQQVSMREEIMDLYLNTIDFMAKGYHISFKKNIHLRLKSAETIRKRCQMSGGGRVLGFYNDKSRELWIESRGPRNAVQDTMIHELTHAWQFAELDLKKLQKKKAEESLLYLEGHACYMEVDIMRKLGEEEYAEFLDWQFEQRDDEYGRGYRMIKKIIAEKASEGSHNTPFAIMMDTVNNL